MSGIRHRPKMDAGDACFSSGVQKKEPNEPFREAAAPAQPVLICDKCGKEIDANITYWNDKKYHATCFSRSDATPPPVLTQPSAEKCPKCGGSGLLSINGFCGEEFEDCYMCKEKRAEAERPVLPVPPEITDRRDDLMKALKCLYIAAPEYVAKDVIDRFEAYENAVISARASSPAVAPTERCPSCGSREKGYRLCMIENCGEPHFEETAFSGTHRKAVCSDSWHSAAPAVAGRTQGDDELRQWFENWCSGFSTAFPTEKDSMGDYRSVLTGNVWIAVERANKMGRAALRESARVGTDSLEYLEKSK
jgi:hypothetical protein